ncbi:MAG: MBL fold metallo-hydrolase, partial [Candidatus Dormibacteraeota bacterium]|nr:MBL fold metallo-hydrolase [Candidatus Dormibacteraeota bacterium]
MNTARTSRRHFLHTAALTATAAHLAPRSLFAQAAPAVAPPDRITQMRTAAASAKITTQPLRGNVSALLGSGGNIAVLTGPADPAKSDGKLCIDSGFSTSHPQVAAALNALSPGRISLLINTHWHFDHTDGNEWMHAAGAEIAAHEKTRDRLSTTQHMAA